MIITPAVLLGVDESWLVQRRDEQMTFEFITGKWSKKNVTHYIIDVRSGPVSKTGKH